MAPPSEASAGSNGKSGGEATRLQVPPTSDAWWAQANGGGRTVVLAGDIAGVGPLAAIDEHELERSRLEADIAAVTARIMADRHHESVLRAAMRGDDIAMRAALTEIERRHEARLAQIRETAQAGAARILIEARQEVAGNGPTPGSATDAGDHVG